MGELKLHTLIGEPEDSLDQRYAPGFETGTGRTAWVSDRIRAGSGVAWTDRFRSLTRRVNAQNHPDATQTPSYGGVWGLNSVGVWGL